MFACTSAPSPSKEITLERAETLHPGASRADVIKLLGKPDQIPDLKGTTAPANLEIWIYSVPGQQIPRFTLEIDKLTNRLLSSSFSIYENEPLNTVEAVKRRYPSLSFKVRPTDVKNHTPSDEVMYADEEKGMGFVFRQGRQEVSSIDWWTLKKRTVADDEKK